MNGKGLRFGLLCLTLGIGRVIANDPVKEEVQETSFWKGITITQQHVDVAKALADYMFSYKDRHAEDQTSAMKIEDIKIEETVPAITPKNVVRVGVLSDCFPFTLKQKDNFAGFEVDLVKLIAEEKNLSYAFQPVNATEMEQKFQDKTIDLALGVSLRDTAAEKNFEFSDGYLSTDLGIVRQKKQRKDATRKLSFVDKKIGVLKNSYLESYIRSAHIQGAEIVTFESTAEMLGALLQEGKERLDFALVDKNTAQHWIAKNPEFEYTSLNIAKEYAFRVAKGSPLLKTINRGIGKILGTQKFMELKRRWSIDEN